MIIDPILIGCLKYGPHQPQAGLLGDGGGGSTSDLLRLFKLEEKLLLDQTSPEHADNFKSRRRRIHST